MKTNVRGEARIGTTNRPGKTNFITEFVADPSLWRLDDERYDWLTEADLRVLDRFSFDFGDLMECANHFLTYDDVPRVLLVPERDLESYCQRLWGRGWKPIYEALLITARNIGQDRIFRKNAERGNSAAISAMGKVMKLIEEPKKSDVAIQFVNNI